MYGGSTSNIAARASSQGEAVGGGGGENILELHVAPKKRCPAPHIPEIHHALLEEPYWVGREQKASVKGRCCMSSGEAFGRSGLDVRGYEPKDYTQDHNGDLHH